MFERFTEKSIKVMTLAQEEARRLGHNYVGTEQILLGLIGENTGIAAKVLRSMGVLLKDARQEVEKIVGRGSGFVAINVPFTHRARRLLELAWDEARQLGHNYIGTEHLLLGLIRENDGVAPQVLEALGVELTKVRMHVIRMLSESGAASSSGTTSYSSGRTKTPTLDEFGRNLTMAAQEGRIDPLIGREAEIDRVIQILGRRTKNNPVLIGEPGVGKTAIAEGLAARIASCDVPEILRDKKVVQLDIGLLVAGTKFRGEFEERLKKLMQEVRSAGNVMLVIDELHTLIGAGGAEGAIDAANILKPALNRGDLQCIGATTLDEYRKRIERDAALARRFQPVIIDPPTVDQTIEIVKGLRQRYEEHHRLEISDEAIEEAAKLSDRYLNDRHLPDKAIDLIDEAASRVRLRASSLPPAAKEVEHELRKTRRDKEGAIRNSEFDKAASLREQETALSNKLQEMKAQNRLDTENTKPLVTAEDVAYVISSMTGIPLVSLTESETARLLSLEDDLHKQVIGQHEAVTKVAKAIRRSRVGLKNPNRPIGSFIFAGPTGVGKTELAKAVAQLMFKDKDAIIRIDMSEYMEHHTTSKLIGSPPGYVGYNDGGQLTEAVRRKPYSVVLFDEIEKAHPDVFNVMLQILDDGRLSDSKGRVVDFKNTIIIMTSNVGAQFIVGGGTKTIGIGAHSIVKQGEDADKAEYAEQQKNIKKLVTDTMKKTFRPEFLNRIDDIVIFQTLRKEEIRDIVDLMAAELNQRIKDQGMFLLISNSAKDLLAKEGYHRDYGARPLKRVIQRRIEDALAEQVLNGTLKEGDFIHAIADGEVIRFETITDKNQAEQLRSQTGFAK